MDFMAQPPPAILPATSSEGLVEESQRELIAHWSLDNRASLYVFCLRVGEIWQIFPSQWLLYISANPNLASGPSAFLCFFSGKQ